MQLFAFKNTEAGIRARRPDPVVPMLVESRSKLLKECAAVRAEIAAERDKLAAEKEKLAAVRAEAQQSVDAANAALRALHEKWAQEAQEKGQKQLKVVRNPMTLNEVIRRMCRATGVSQADIMSRRRTREMALARQGICYWAARRTGHSFAQIGRLMGIDHTTALHAASVYPEKRAKMGRHLRRVR